MSRRIQLTQKHIDIICKLKSLKPSDKLVIIGIYQWGIVDNMYRLDQQALAKYVGLGLRTVTGCIRALKDHNLLETEKVNKRVHYHFLDHPVYKEIN